MNHLTFAQKLALVSETAHIANMDEFGPFWVDNITFPKVLPSYDLSSWKPIFESSRESLTFDYLSNSLEQAYRATAHHHARDPEAHRLSKIVELLVTKQLLLHCLEKGRLNFITNYTYRSKVQQLTTMISFLMASEPSRDLVASVELAIEFL